MTTREAQAAGSLLRDMARFWWLFLVTGIIWLVVALIVLRFDTTSITTVGVLMGVLFAVAAVNEFFVFAVVVGGWRWLHLALAVLFVAGAIYAFISPQDAFWALASVLGLLLVLLGTLHLIRAIAEKDMNPLWWLLLATGILEILLGFWASQQFFRARAALILVWVGLMALFRGITEIVLAFQVKSAGRELEDAGY